MEPDQNKPRFLLKKTENDLNELLENKESSNTKKATKSAANVFRNYCTERGKESHFESFSTEELANALKYFTPKLSTKKDGEFYKKSSLNSICVRVLPDILKNN
jgi:hypothetical protein